MREDPNQWGQFDREWAVVPHRRQTGDFRPVDWKSVKQKTITLASVRIDDAIAAALKTPPEPKKPRGKRKAIPKKQK